MSENSEIMVDHKVAEQPVVHAKPRSLSRWVAYPLLLIFFVAGLVLRVWDVNIGKGIHSHPDERSTACFYATTIDMPKSWDEFWDPTQSRLNPLWNVDRQERRGFTYGHFPLYVGVLAGEALHYVISEPENIDPETGIDARREAEPHWLTENNRVIYRESNPSCNEFIIAGRWTIALFDALTILLLFGLGATIFGRGAGLIAAGFYAFTAQAVQSSHFFAMDPASGTFTVMAIWGSVLIIQRRSWTAIMVAGIGAGLAIASKFSALPILAAPVVACILALWQDSQRRRYTDEPIRSGPQLMTLLAIPLVLILAGVTFFITSPYAILDWENFSQATLVEQGRMVRGVADMPFTRQYRNTTPYLYFIQQQFNWGLGWPLGALAALGSLIMLGDLLRTMFRFIGSGFSTSSDNERSEKSSSKLISTRALGVVVVWSWIIPYFGLTGAFLAKFNRYMLPLLPFVLLFAAGTIWLIWRDVSSTGRETFFAKSLFFLRRSFALILTLIGLVGGLFWATAYVNGVYNHEHTWAESSRWMYENIPSGSLILWERWDDPLPKSLPREPGMDMGSTGLRHIDWSPYEEDTPEKYEQMKAKLREADYVAYSSKRIYDSVDELPERYPMTILYYESMWNGDLGFELVGDFTSPPQLFGLVFEDRLADESWSLYDHPQVTIFRKERDLTDAEFDALFEGTLDNVEYWYRGEDSPLSPLLNVLGLGSSPASEDQGLISSLIGLATGKEDGPSEQPEDVLTALQFEQKLHELPVVDDYRWNKDASESPMLATLWWWFVTALLGWLAWPISFAIFKPLRDRGYLFSRTVGWLFSGWLLWFIVSMGYMQNNVRDSWIIAAVMGVLGLAFLIAQWRAMGQFIRKNWGILFLGEFLFGAAYLLFIFIRIRNPDIWQPWFGGEKFMEFAFLNGILRSPTFPPVDPHFAGGFINYYYFGIYLVTYLIKLTGIYAEVAFNLAIASLFALTAINTYAVAYSAVGWHMARLRRRPVESVVSEPAPLMLTDEFAEIDDDTDPTEIVLEEDALASDEIELDYSESDDIEADSEGLDELVEEPNVPEETWSDDISLPWYKGALSALLAPLFVVMLGNLDGLGQIVRNLARYSTSEFQSSFSLLETLVHSVNGLMQVLNGTQTWPSYNFWDPSRVIPYTINEFPYWSFLFADLHPHLIGIPLAALFLGLVLALLADPLRSLWRGLSYLFMFGLMLGALASVNLWELPTYLGLGLLAFIVSQQRRWGTIHWLWTAIVGILYLASAYLLFLPFFNNYENIGASGVGMVKEPDALGTWLLIWGFFVFILISWFFYAAGRPARPVLDNRQKLSGLERWISLAFGQFDRLPRMAQLHSQFVQRPTLTYLLGVILLPITLVLAGGALYWGRTVLALCILMVGGTFMLLWRRGQAADAGAVLIALLATTGAAILAGTQIIYLKDFLGGGDWYRMNTLFKFFSQVWVIWGVAAAIALPRVLSGITGWQSERATAPLQKGLSRVVRGAAWRGAWMIAFVALLLTSLAYLIWGTPARLDQRMIGWQPEYGTLNGMAFMEQGSYTWPDSSHEIELAHDWDAIRWLLDNVRGNLVIVESAEVDYYRAGGTRVASFTGLSGLRGKHESEQRYGEQLGPRDGLHREFWSTSDVARTQQLIADLDIALIYVSQLERHQHPGGVEKMADMAASGLLEILFENEGVIIYSVPGTLSEHQDGYYYPNQEMANEQDS